MTAIGRYSFAAGKGPVIVELVGSPGAGKTTLFERLRAREPKVVPPRLKFSKRSLLYNFIKYGRQSPQLFVRDWAATLSVTALDLKYMARLFVLHDTICRSSHDGNLVLSDHGPLFRLTYFRVFGSPFARTAAFEQWESDWRRWCSATFDLIVWLDAPDDVLIERINARAQFHPDRDRIIGKNREDRVNLFARRRHIYREMCESFGLPVLRIDTYHEPMGDWLERVVHAIKERRNAKACYEEEEPAAVA